LLHDQIENIINQWFFEIKNDIYNFTKYSKDISYAIALADIADMVIGPDSSMIHIAESVKTKNFGIYGPFPGKIRLSTYKYNDWVDCKSNCSPCFTHGHRPCLYGGQNGGCSPCYQNINMSEFIEKFKELELRHEI
jgi:ADP-heptose:LPS heptosyltransferase